MTEVDQEGMASNWEFIDRHPTTDEVASLLKSLAPVFGVSVADFADYVQALPQSKKSKVPNPDRPGSKVDRYMDTWSLYMTVAGRLAMVQRIAEENGFRIDFAQDWMDDGRESGRIVLREAVTIRDADGRSLGTRSGTAHVPYKGGQGAAGSNPYSRVETAARGRAIAAWGIGVLPGSGVASVEEIQSAASNAAAERQGPAQQQPPLSPDEVLSEVKTLMAKIRQKRNMDEPEINAMIGKRLGDLGVKSAYDEDAAEVDWRKPNSGQLTLLMNDLRAHLRNLENEGAEL